MTRRIGANQDKHKRMSGDASGPFVTAELEDRWLIEWTTSGLLGQKVVFRNVDTGEGFTGRAYTGWEKALRRATAIRSKAPGRP